MGGQKVKVVHLTSRREPILMMELELHWDTSAELKRSRDCDSD